jgi:hypothetical protein
VRAENASLALAMSGVDEIAPERLCDLCVYSMKHQKASLDFIASTFSFKSQERTTERIIQGTYIKVRRRRNAEPILTGRATLGLQLVEFPFWQQSPSAMKQKMVWIQGFHKHEILSPSSAARGEKVTMFHYYESCVLKGHKQSYCTFTRTGKVCVIGHFGDDATSSLFAAERLCV